MGFAALWFDKYIWEFMRCWKFCKFWMQKSWVEGIGQISSRVKGISTNFIVLSSLRGSIWLISMLSFVVVGAWVLENGRRIEVCYMRYNNGNNNRRSRRNPFRQNILRDINDYAEYLIQNWQSGFDHEEEPSNKGPSWFRRPDSGSRRSWTNDQRRQNMRRRGFSFCDDDDDDEASFRSAFGDRFFFWSFVHQDYPNWRTSSRYSNRHNTSWKRRHQSEDEYEYTSEEDSPKSDLASERTALGLDASGPLKIEDVKNAYRACALKWHPDRHQGSSKAAAEEKFKLCTAAYQSLCDRLPVN